jgi:hypothetical protein
MLGCSLPQEFPQLLDDVDVLQWANEAFGTPPEATNLWIGDDDSITSFHKVCLSMGNLMSRRAPHGAAHFFLLDAVPCWA